MIGVNLTYTKKIFLILVPILAYSAFLFSARPASAIVKVLDQYSTASAIYSTYGTTAVVQTFKPTQSNIAAFFMAQVIKQDNGTQIGYYVCRGLPDTENIQSTYNCGAANNEEVVSGIVVISGTTVNLSFDLVDSVPNTGAYWYYISLFPLDGKKARFIFAPVQAGSVSNTEMRGYGEGVPTDYNMYFQEYYDASDNRNIIKISPINKTISNSTFNGFNIAVNVPEVWLFSNWTIRIDYGTSTSALINQSKLTQKFDYSSWNNLTMPKTIGLSNGTWYWRAYAYIGSDDYGNPYATSTIDSFEVDNFSPAKDLSIFKEPTQEEICIGIDTETFFGGIECGFKKVLAWAFFPKSQTIEDFKNKADNLKSSFPFNTVFDITDGIRAGIASTTIEDDSFKIPFIAGDKASNSYYMLPVLSSSSMAAMIGNENTDNFRLIQKIFIYIVAIGFVYFSIKWALL